MLKPGSKYWYLVTGMTKLDPGKAFHAEKGYDFTCEPETFRNVLYQAAYTAGNNWRVSTIVVNGTVVWACWKSTDYMRPNLPAYPIVKKIRKEN